MMQTLKTKLSESLRLLAAKVHALFADAFYVYKDMIQSGWYEALEQPASKSIETQCPVKRLINKKDSISLTFKDTIA